VYQLTVYAKYVQQSTVNFALTVVGQTQRSYGRCDQFLQRWNIRHCR
jgi:hypothetical protein